MSREVVLASEEQGFEEEIKVDVDVDKSDAVIKSESDTKTTGGKETVPTKSEHSNDTESENRMSYIDDEEDVPSDFFDDFSNQDFMAGLDIVDAWDEEEFMDDKEKAKKIPDSRDLRQKNRRRRTERERDRRRHSRSPIRRPHRSKDRSRGSRDRDRRHRSKDVKSKEKPKDKDPKEGDEAVDHRRDPEKTKRDIQKDKDKCAKNKEAKIISEKLKVVETGLVPPGTEMEVDLKQLKSAMPAVKELDKKTTSTREEKGNVREERRNTREEKPSTRDEKGGMREEKQTYEKRRRSRSTSGEVLRSRYVMREKRYSPLRRSRSPRGGDRKFEHRVRLRSRSPYRGRSRTRSPYYRDRERRKMSSERRNHIEERKRFNRYRNTSPTVLRRKSRDRSLNLSPISNISDRELWLRQRERDKRERKISCSPISDTESMNRKRSHDFLEELASKLKSERKKKSFLREIQERLNEPSQHKPNYSMVSVPGPVPPPIPGVNSAPGPMHVLHPVPGPGFMPGPPHQFFPQSDPAPQYDQQFFIGQPMFHDPNPYAPSFMGPTPVPTTVGPISAVPPISDSIIVAHPMNSPIKPHPNFNGKMQNNVDLLKVQKAAVAQKEKDQEAIAKLFEDKKISLSDFLSMSAKHADPSKPVNVQKKIKVISLCQDAIKSLGGESKLSGRFFRKKTFRETEKKEESKFQSPLRKIPVVRFSFTTPTKGGDDKSTLQSTSSKLIASLGLIEATRPVTPKPSLSPVSSEASVKSIPLKKIVSVKTPPPRRYDPILGAKFQMKMCQTDPVKCNICEIRKVRKFVDQAIQCSIRTVDSGTQITDEDMQRLARVPMKDAFRNQSFAHLTPAQILAAQPGGHEESPTKKDIFPAARMMTPPPPDISPEKHNIRANLSNNDSFPNRSDRFKSDHFSSQSNTVNRPGGFKPTSIFDKLIPGSFDNVNRSHNSFESVSRPSLFENVNTVRPNFDNRTHIMQQIQQHNDNRFRGNNQGFNQRMADDDKFDYEQPPNNYSGSNNQRPFLANNRGTFLPGPYGGRKFF